MLKKAKHWILILLVCVLFVGLIPAKAFATGEYWDYNGTILPALPDEAANYRYKCIAAYDSNDPDLVDYRLVLYDTISVITVGWQYDNLTMPANSGGTYKGYYLDYAESDNWQYYEGFSGTVGSSAKYILPVNGNGWSFVWSNVDLYDENSQKIYTGTEAGVFDFPETPKFRVNLPSNYVYQYAVDETAAQLYVDAYVDEPAAVLTYSWQRYYDGNWLNVDNGSGKYYTPSTAAEGVVRYRCVVRNALDDLIATATSNTVYVVVGETAVLPDGEDGQISPGDQIMIDQTGQIMDDVSDIKDSMEKLPEDIKDGMSEALEQEKTEAESTGNDLVETLTGLIPDMTDDLMGGFQALAAAFSYEGTEAVLHIPALVMPEIPGVCERTVLLGAQDVNLEYYVSLAPENLLIVVRALTALALGLYCAKEFYDVIAYFFMGRKEHE